MDWVGVEPTTSKVSRPAHDRRFTKNLPSSLRLHRRKVGFTFVVTLFIVLS